MLIFVPAEDPAPNCARPSPVRIMTRNLNIYSAKFKLVLKILFTFSLIRWRHLIWSTRFHEISWYFVFQKEITVCYNWYNSQKTPIPRPHGRAMKCLLWGFGIWRQFGDNIPSSFLWLEWFLISFREPGDVIQNGRRDLGKPCECLSH